MKKIIDFLKSHKKLTLFLAILLIAGFLIRSIFFPKKEKEQYQTTQVEKGTIVSSVTASGHVLSINIMSASTKASGIVNKVYVKDGDNVKEGDKILEIDLDFQGKQKNAQAWASYLSAKNSLESAKTTQYTLQSALFQEWDSFKNLAENSTYTNSDDTPNFTNRNLPEFHIAEKNWLAAEAKYKNQQSVITQSQAAANSSYLSYVQTSSVITAPTDGVITSLMYTEGMSIGSLDTGNSESNQKVATIKTEGTSIVSVNLSEIDVSRVELGQKATIILDSITDKTFTGKVIGVDRIGTENNGVVQYPAIIKLDSLSEEILPNLSVSTNIIIASKSDVLILPSGAVQEQNGQSVVQVLKNGEIQFVPVETGLTSDTQTEILSGVSQDDKIVIGTNSAASSSQGGRSPFSSGFGGIRQLR